MYSSCGSKTYQSASASFVVGQQKNIAILPQVVSLEAHPKTNAEMLIEQQKKESVNFQNEIYSWLLPKKMQGEIQQQIQDISSTNALLKKSRIPGKPLTRE